MGSAANSLGVVSVQVTADGSQLQRTLDILTSQAAASGGKMAVAFTSATGPAAALTQAAEGLAGVTVKLTADTAALVQVTNAGAAAQRNFASAAHGSVTEIQATSGALRVLEGSGGIRAAERFLTLIPGLGPALQAAFPIIGAIALFDALTRLADKVIDLKGAQEALAKATEESDKAAQHLAETLDHLTVEHIVSEFGAASGKIAEAMNMDREAKRLQTVMVDIQDSVSIMADSAAKSIQNFIPIWSHFFDEATLDRMKTAVEQIRSLNTQVKELQAEADAKREQGGQEAAREAGSLSAKKLEDELAAFKKSQEQKAQSAREGVQAIQEAQQLVIDGYTSEYVRAQASGALQEKSARDLASRLEAIATETANFEIRQLARIGAARSSGQDRPKQVEVAEDTRAKQAEAQATAANAYVNQGAAASAAAAKSGVALIELQRRSVQALNADILKGFEELDKGWDKLRKEVAATQDEIARGKIRAGEIAQESVGDVAALKAKGVLELANIEYGKAAEHTLSQQRQHVIEIAEMERKATQERIAGYEAALKTLEAQLDIDLNTAKEAHDLEAIAELQKKIADLKQQQANASAVATARAGELTPQTQIEDAFKSAAARTPSAVGKGLASGIIDGRRIGQDIRESLKGIGKEMLGEVISALVTALIGNTVATIANTAGTSLNTALGHLGIHLGAAPKPGVKPGTQTAGPTTTTPAEQRQVVQTAETNTELRAIQQTLIGNQQQTFAQAATMQTQQLAASSIAQTQAWVEIGELAAIIALLTKIAFSSSASGGGGGGLEEAVTTAITFLADGGSPPVGVPSIVGERGPELFVPSVPGTIFPAGSFSRGGSGGGAATAMSAASYSSNSSNISGDLHFHAHGIANPRQHAEMMTREVPRILKQRSGGLGSPYSR